MLLQAGFQQGKLLQKISVLGLCPVMPQGDFQRLLFNNPVLFHISDVERCYIGVLLGKAFEFVKIIFEQDTVFQRLYGETARGFFSRALVDATK